MDPQKLIFWMAQARVPVFFAVSRYLRYKYFDVVWGMAPSGIPPKPIFWTTQFTMPVFFDISSGYFGDKYFDIVWGCHPPGTPRNQFFWLAQTRALIFFKYQHISKRQMFWHHLKISLPRVPPQSGPPKIKFLHDQVYDACVFDISRYFRGKHFDRVWEYHPPPRTPQTEPP